MSLGATYLDKLRNNHPHITKYNMTVILPDVVYCGTISNSPDFGSSVINVLDVSGDITDIEEGMMVYIGTSCGDYSVSKRRFRSRVGQALTLDENSINWALGMYVTVVDFYELRSVFPYIDPDTLEFYKDGDIPYTDQNQYPPPVAIAGPHRAKFLDAAAATFQLDASDSYAIASGASISSYLWENSDGGVIDSASSAITEVTFTTCGKHIMKCTVTDSNGKSQSTLRYFYVHERTGSCAPYYNVHFKSSPSGDWMSGGWKATLEVYIDVPVDDFPDNALVILWSEDTYEGQEYYYTDYSNIKMCGYFRRSTVDKNFDTGSVSFDVVTIEQLLANCKMMSISLTWSNSPTTWYEYAHLTAARAVHHLWKYHSTLFNIADVYLPIDEDTEIPACDDFEKGNLYTQADNFLYSRGIFAHVVCDKYGIIRVEQDISMMDVTIRDALEILFDLDLKDYIPEVQISINPFENMSYVIVSGGYGTTALVPVISQAPGEVPHAFGSMDGNMDSLILYSQAHGNVVAGRVLANANRYIEEIRLKFAGNYLAALDIVPQRWIGIVSMQNVRGLNLTGKYLLRSLMSNINVENGVTGIDAVLVPDVDGPDGIPGPYPPGLGDSKGHDEPDDPGWTDEGIDPEPATYVCHNNYVFDLTHTVTANQNSLVKNISANTGTVVQLFTSGNSDRGHVVSDDEYVYWSGVNLDETKVYRLNVDTSTTDYIDVGEDVYNLTLVEKGILYCTTADFGTHIVKLYKIDFGASTATLVRTVSPGVYSLLDQFFIHTTWTGSGYLVVFDIVWYDGSGAKKINWYIHNYSTSVDSTEVVDLTTVEGLYPDWVYLYAMPVYMVENGVPKLDVIYTIEWDGGIVGETYMMCLSMNARYGIVSSFMNWASPTGSYQQAYKFIPEYTELKGYFWHLYVNVALDSGLNSVDIVNNAFGIVDTGLAGTDLRGMVYSESAAYRINTSGQFYSLRTGDAKINIGALWTTKSNSAPAYARITPYADDNGYIWIYDPSSGDIDAHQIEGAGTDSIATGWTPGGSYPDHVFIAIQGKWIILMDDSYHNQQNFKLIK